MRGQIFFNQLFVVLIILASVVFFGCENKTNNTKTEMDNTKSEKMMNDTNSVDVTSDKKELVGETKVFLIDLKGTWTGIFDKRSTILKITEQIDSSFSGNISISYREKINQDVKGSFNPTTMNMTMKDQLHSRYRGTYNGKLSEDGRIFSGTFTMDLDGSKFSFNLNKK